MDVWTSARRASPGAAFIAAVEDCAASTIWPSTPRRLLHARPHPRGRAVFPFDIARHSPFQSRRAAVGPAISGRGLRSAALGGVRTSGGVLDAGRTIFSRERAPPGAETAEPARSHCTECGNSGDGAELPRSRAETAEPARRQRSRRGVTERVRRQRSRRGVTARSAETAEPARSHRAECGVSGAGAETRSRAAETAEPARSHCAGRGDSGAGAGGAEPGAETAEPARRRGAGRGDSGAGAETAPRSRSMATLARSLHRPLPRHSARPALAPSPRASPSRRSPRRPRSALSPSRRIRSASSRTSARIASREGACQRPPWPGKTHSNESSERRSIDWVCSGHECQQTSREAWSRPRRPSYQTWSPLKRCWSSWRSATLPRVWPGTGTIVRSASSFTGARPLHLALDARGAGIDVARGHHALTAEGPVDGLGSGDVVAVGEDYQSARGRALRCDRAAGGRRAASR